MANGGSEVLSDLPLPSSDGPLPSSSVIASGPYVSSKGRISLYEPAEWEEFTLEWVTVLRPRYVQVLRFGGSGDRGIDIAAFRSEDRLLGPWDLFQCKHYEKPLRPADFFPEVFKVLLAVAEEVYSLPQRYRIVAPKECGTALELLLSNPANLKTEFCSALEARDRGLSSAGSDDQFAKVAALAETIDFGIFKSESLLDVINDHRSSPYHAARFGGGLGPRPAVEAPPDEPESDEHRYLEQLMAVYDEAFPPPGFCHEVALDRSDTAKHYIRQREAFYSAEALREFSRDETPDGTFEALQAEIFDGVIETHDRPDGTGLERLTSVMEAAMSVGLSANGLISVVQPRDRKGICHQLANEDRLTWVGPSASV